MSKNRIKPCPFCGFKDPLVEGHRKCYWVQCHDYRGGCGSRGSSRINQNEAIIAWNKRVVIEGGEKDEVRGGFNNRMEQV